MFGRKKEGKKERPAKGRAGMTQLGLLDMDGYYNVDPQTGAAAGMDEEDDDDGLEAELLAITSGKAPMREKRARKAPMHMDDFDQMIEASLKDPQSDEEDDEDLENDPELMAELQQLSPDEPPSPKKSSPRRPAPPPPVTEQPVTSSYEPQLSSYEPPPLSMESQLEERLSMYKKALEKAAGDSAKTRRLDRGIKTLNGLLKSARAGKTIDESEIPPEVAVAPPKSQLEPTPVMLQEEIMPNREPSPPPSDPMIDLLQWAENLTQIPDSPPTSEASSPKRLSPAPLSPKRDDVSDISSPDFSVDNDTEKEKKMVLEMLGNRKKQYQKAALDAKKSQDSENAIKYIKIAKQFQVVIIALEQGQPIDLSQMPPPPPGFSDDFGAISPSPPSSITTCSSELPETISESEPPDPTLFKAPPAPCSTLEALEQRKEKYTLAMKEAQEQENTSKSRRMGRIVKQYEDAIKLYKAGKAVPYDDLPDPPGFAPIPREGSSSSGKSIPTAGAPPKAVGGQVEVPSAGLVPKSSPGRRVSSEVGSSKGSTTSSPAGPSAAKTKAADVPTARQNIQERQLQNLQQRQKLFRDAALEAKKKGDIEAAKEYLRISKGFNPMIEASKSGFPVNLDTAPIPPQVTRKKEMETESEGFEVIEVSDCMPQGDREEMYEKLEADLKTQIAMCAKNRDHFSQLGDINHSRKFQLLMEHANKDLMCLKYALKHGDPVPRFHYEMKTFNIVQCFTELNDNDCELTIVRGINYYCSNPKDVDTYVRFEFPFPSENSPKDRTVTVKDTNNPEYNQTFMLSINRKARSLARVFKRYAVKCEVMAKGGFFHSDHCLGIAQVKLAPLESKCFIHDSFDLMDGRKPTGGKLEVKIRIREPLLSRQVEQIKEKWVVIDQYVIK